MTPESCFRCYRQGEYRDSHAWNANWVGGRYSRLSVRWLMMIELSDNKGSEAPVAQARFWHRLAQSLSTVPAFIK